MLKEDGSGSFLQDKRAQGPENKSPMTWDWPDEIGLGV